MTRFTVLRDKPWLSGVLAVLVIIGSGVAVVLALRDNAPQAAATPPDDTQLLLQAERNPPGFLVQFGHRPWREQPLAVAKVLATMRFELALGDRQALALSGDAAVPNTTELTAAYQAMGLPEAVALVTAHAAVAQPAAAGDAALAACQARYRALRPKIVAARKTFLLAHLDEVHQALAQ